MFGRMFPNLEPLAVDEAPLKELADAMKDANPGDTAGNNTKIPAGFTYLGQFVDHDITLDLTSFGGKEADPTGVENSAPQRLISTVFMASALTAAGSFTRAIPAIPTARRPVRNS